MNLPVVPPAVVSGEDWMDVYWKKFRSSQIPWPRASVSLIAYLAWPNDEERRNSFIATCLVLFHKALAAEVPSDSKELASLGGVAAIAKSAFIPLLGEIVQLERKWLEVAEVFQLIIDMTFDDRAVLRRGPSVSKAIDLCELERELRRHSQVRRSWSEFRDVAHLLTASAVLDPDSLVPAKKPRGDAYILAPILAAPDIVLALAHELQEFGLSPRRIHKEQPTLRPDSVWRIPPSHAPENPFVIFRDLTDAQRAFLISRRVSKKAA